MAPRPASVPAGLLPLLAALALAACEGRPPDPGPVGPAQVRPDATEWPHYGGDAGGTRYSPLDRITRENVHRLRVAWTHHTGDVSDGEGEVPSTTAFEATPILVDGVLFVCTPMNRVLALDPETGALHWSFDPEIDLAGDYANQLVCRGVSFWRDPEAEPGGACARRIFTATNDAFLWALDARTGEPCADFGDGGRVDLNEGVGEALWRGEYQVTSPPVIGDDPPRVVVGSAVSDNARTDAPSGVVRAFDPRSGELVWAQDLAPPGFERTPENTGSHGYALGTPNVWAPMSVDETRGLVFVPTGNPAPDYWRGGELAAAEIDHYGSSVVALDLRTGSVVWSFATVHHDLWDYDVPAQPTLARLRRPEGGSVDAVVQPTKMGLLFTLDRDTGEPVHPVEERPVPQDGAPGEVLSPTQPFPVAPPPWIRHELAPEDAFGLAFFDRRACEERIRALRTEGIYTPPSLQGSLMVPGNAGGTNWGGVAVDPLRQVAIANVSDLPFVVTLLPGEDFERERAANPGVEISPQWGTPFAMRREPFLSPLELPCVKPPWGKLLAVDLVSGEILWERPLGTTRDIAPLPIPWEAGVPNIGGSLVTASGLVFIGAAIDDYLRAFDVETGEELLRARLPAGGQATPMTYVSGGRQYVVIASGGHGRMGTTLGDSLVAFALPDDGDDGDDAP